MDELKQEGLTPPQKNSRPNKLQLELGILSPCKVSQARGVKGRGGCLQICGSVKRKGDVCTGIERESMAANR
jgi:hypothetical protein